MCESSKIVPTRTVNFLRQALHFQMPPSNCSRSVLVFVSSLYAPTDLQCGQPGHQANAKTQSIRGLSSRLNTLVPVESGLILKFLITPQIRGRPQMGKEDKLQAPRRENTQ